MKNNYNNATGTLEDLYALIERDRTAAETLSKSVFKEEVALAVSRISDTCQVSSARIMADVQVTSAKLASDAEVAAAHLAAEAEVAAVEILQKVSGDTGQQAVEIAQGMIAEMGRVGSEKLSEHAQESIAAIQKEADQAIEALKQKSAQSIEEIQVLADRVTGQLKENAKLAATKFTAFKDHDPTRVEVVQEAAEAADKILQAAEEYSIELQAAVNEAIIISNRDTDRAIIDLKAASDISAQRIIESRVKAKSRIDEVVESALKIIHQFKKPSE